MRPVVVADWGLVVAGTVVSSVVAVQASLLAAILSETAVVQLLIAAMGGGAVVGAAAIPVLISTRRGVTAAAAVTTDEVTAVKSDLREVARSVGEQNGHGSVQDATKEILSRIDGLQTSVESVVDSAQNVTARLKEHDREFVRRRSAHEADVEAIRAEIREARDIEIAALREEIRSCRGRER